MAARCPLRNASSKHLSTDADFAFIRSPLEAAEQHDRREATVISVMPTTEETEC
jgi:hypothetical protein